MELPNEFVVRVPLDKAWALLTDLEQIAPCMPGAKLEEVRGEPSECRARCAGRCPQC